MGIYNNPEDDPNKHLVGYIPSPKRVWVSKRPQNTLVLEKGNLPELPKTIQNFKFLFLVDVFMVASILKFTYYLAPFSWKSLIKLLCNF